MSKKNGIPERRVKLLVGIIGREEEGSFTATCNECCPSLHFSGIGFGTAKSNYLSYLGLNEIEKRIVYALIPDDAEKKVLQAISRKLKLYLMGKGIAFTIPLSGISSIIANAILSNPAREDAGNNRTVVKKEKKAMHELIVAVVHQKFTDEVIDCARAAGATGATVFHTKSIGNEQAEQLIGTSLKQETDTVMFLTSRAYKQRIMEAIRDSAGLKTDGGAVLFSLPVDRLVGIGRFEE